MFYWIKPNRMINLTLFNNKLWILFLHIILLICIIVIIIHLCIPLVLLYWINWLLNQHHCLIWQASRGGLRLDTNRLDTSHSQRLNRKFLGTGRCGWWCPIEPCPNGRFPASRLENSEYINLTNVSESEYYSVILHSLGAWRKCYAESINRNFVNTCLVCFMQPL